MCKNLHKDMKAPRCIKLMNVFFIIIIQTFFFHSCSNSREVETKLDIYPNIYPDYNHIVIPPNIAPLNFSIEDSKEIQASFCVEGSELFSVVSKENTLSIPPRKWENLLSKAIGKSIHIHISVWNSEYPQGVGFLPIEIQVATEPIDSWIAYRLIEPGYQSWKQLGIYQRDITSFKEEAIVTNHSNTQTCLNCHSFANYSADKMMFHARGTNGGTYILNAGKVSKVNIEKIGLKKGASYPIWHPNKKLLTFSSNTTQQAFFEHGKQALEVYDQRSDLIFYDTETNEVFSDPRFLTNESMETYPAWSPDGNTLYYVSAKAKKVPQENKDMHYSLLRVSFDSKTCQFGENIDTLYNAHINKGSISYPRISPDGKYLLYTWSSYGTFPIWHQEADLQMINLENNRNIDVSIWNSNEADSYHSWSSNGRWIVFGSRRLDGRYTNLYIAYWDVNGKAYKPFLLPQKNPKQNIWRLKSFNIPEFIQEKVELTTSNFTEIAQ